jgi:hypothetical protein
LIAPAQQFEVLRIYTGPSAADMLDRERLTFVAHPYRTMHFLPRHSMGEPAVVPPVAIAIELARV